MSSSVGAAIPSQFQALYLPAFAERSELGVASLRLSARPSSSLLDDLREDDVIVAVEAASLNPSDAKNAQGFMGVTQLPRIIGRDFCGTVIHAGTAAEAQAWVGKSVFGTGGDVGCTRDGSFSQLLRLPASAVVERPSSFSVEQAASVGVNFVTAASALFVRARVTAADIVLITGASGGVGAAAVQLAKNAGAKVIAIQRTSPKEGGAAAAAAASPADVTLFLDAIGGFKGVGAAVRALPLVQEHFASSSSKRRGATVVFDVVGGNDAIPPLMDALATRGRMAFIAMPLPPKPLEIDGLTLYRQELSLLGVNSLLLTAHDCATILRKLRVDFEAGKLKPAAERATIVPPEELGQALSQVAFGKAKGKFILRFSAL